MTNRLCLYENCNETCHHGFFCSSNCERYHERRLVYLEKHRYLKPVTDSSLLSTMCQHYRTAPELWLHLRYHGYEVSVDDLRTRLSRLVSEGLVVKRFRQMRFEKVEIEYAVIDEDE